MVLRVQQLKDRLGHTQDPKKISKALKNLQELDISLDILVETGIGKTVNSFRKHYDVGDIARGIVLQWKKLVPDVKELQVDQKPKHKHDKEVSEEKKINHPASKEKNVCAEKKSLPAEVGKHSESCKISENKKTPQPKEKLEKSSSSKRHNSEKLKDQSHSKEKNSKHSSRDKLENNSSSSNHATKKKTSPNDDGKECDKNSVKPKSHVNEHHVKEGSGIQPDAKPNNEDEFDVPTMSFESYLNYDQVSTKRKKKSCLSEPPKKVQICKQYCNAASLKSETSPNLDNPTSTETKMEVDEDTPKEVKVGSLADLLNIPLPKFLPDYTIMPSPPHITDNKANIIEGLPDPGSESSGFTGRRLNSKMLVYSGSKTIYLPKMLTLYAQCIRVLQNNIDSIQEVGGVPFGILMPVLERCTPEQLSHIEECNPTFIEDSGHLWKKHCQRDFKGHELLEYESWREMYIRLFTEREEKLRLITQNISSAHSGKPKGRQVKLAYIHSAAKPPRYIRRKQEINGTAGPIIQPHPMDKFKVQKNENKDRTIPVNIQTSSTTACVIHSNIPSSGPSQDPKKVVKRIAPMMAKSMRAFRNRVGPR
ncbi:elongin-A-like [Pelobates fuscus]|uniref:elongin-A-like n=1 Tax=Pelobates fuscus TaxID=191477 RepID=UPI002FE4C056